jgi:hypothetical protein
MQCNYSSAYSDFNIQLNVSALLLEISRQFNESYTVICVLNTPHTRQFTQCVLWSRTYTMYLQLRIFGLQYSAVGTCADIGYILKIQWALYYKLGAKYSAHPPFYTMWTVDPHIQATIFNWTYLRCNWRYLDNSMLVILRTWCQIQRTSSRFRYVNSGPGHIQCIYSSAYSGFNIQLNVSAPQL